MNLKFGKKPAQPQSAVTLKFADVFNTAAILPTIPKVIGHETLVKETDWGMLGNDQYGDCVWAGAAHEHMLFTSEGGGPAASFTEGNVLSDYSAVTGFKTWLPFSDQGTDMVVAAKYRQTTGIIDSNGLRHKIDAYAQIKIGDLDELALSTYIFGLTGFGIVVPDNAEDQFRAGQVWDGGNTSDNGHYICCVGRNSVGNFVFVTWGKLQAATPAWVQKYMDEGLAYISMEMLDKTTKVSREHYDMDALTQYLKVV